MCVAVFCSTYYTIETTVGINRTAVRVVISWCWPPFGHFPV